MRHTIQVFIFLFCLIFHTLSFAVLPAPKNLIPLASETGAKIFKRTEANKYFWSLTLQLVTEQNQTYCTIASSVMILNALNIPAPTDPLFAPFPYFTQDNFFKPQVENIVSKEKVRKKGATLEEISRALRTYPIQVKTIFANQITIENFRTLTSNTIAKQQGYVLVNFIRTGLGEQGAGHVSPLAAYDKLTDRFLLLDVARYRYPSVWIKTKDLWHAMYTVDKESGRYRGMIIVSRKQKS